MKILIADDHALFRDGLSLHVEKFAPKAIILQAANFSQAVKIAQSTPDLNLIIIDLDMPDMDWADGIRTLQETAPDTRLVIISATEDVRNIKKALDMGVSGYIPKRSDTKVITSALHLILEGGTYLPPSIMEQASKVVASTQSRNNKLLTPRQEEVLSYVAEGMSNKQIAYKMSVSEATVKLHINALLRAIGATNRTQAVIIAQKRGLI
ncbi:MAG: response regulator transcription factor [Alphaproteobacteria bacterium]|nr:response regulator transcription factor [Alphaproteobacteria bacterium]